MTTNTQVSEEKKLLQVTDVLTFLKPTNTIVIEIISYDKIIGKELETFLNCLYTIVADFLLTHPNNKWDFDPFPLVVFIFGGNDVIPKKLVDKTLDEVNSSLTLFKENKNIPETNIIFNYLRSAICQDEYKKLSLIQLYSRLETTRHCINNILTQIKTSEYNYGEMIKVICCEIDSYFVQSQIRQEESKKNSEILAILSDFTEVKEKPLYEINLFVLHEYVNFERSIHVSWDSKLLQSCNCTTKDEMNSCENKICFGNVTIRFAFAIFKKHIYSIFTKTTDIKLHFTLFQKDSGKKIKLLNGKMKHIYVGRFNASLTKKRAGGKFVKT